MHVFVIIYVISEFYYPARRPYPVYAHSASPRHRRTRSRWRQFFILFCRFSRRRAHRCFRHSFAIANGMAPRTQTASNPSLRNRNRVTNKTRLKVIKGNIDADPIVLDEDEERARVVSTAGVDAEDANVSTRFSTIFSPSATTFLWPCWTHDVAHSHWFFIFPRRSTD